MYETVWGDGSPINNFSATMLAEGVDSREDDYDTIRAWSYLIGTGLAYKLQSWFGRTAKQIIDSGTIRDDGTVNWDSINHEPE